MKTRQKLSSRFDLIEQMAREGLSHEEMSEKLSISVRHVKKHIGLMRGVKYAKRKDQRPKIDRTCRVCGFRFDPLLRDGQATKCEACYQYMISKLICKTCGKVFPENNAVHRNLRRVECFTCKPTKSDLSERFPRIWRDPRWFELFKRYDSGCLVCGSHRARERDGRFCSWQHDPDYLDDNEAEALLIASGWVPDENNASNPSSAAITGCPTSSPL